MIISLLNIDYVMVSKSHQRIQKITKTLEKLITVTNENADNAINDLQHKLDKMKSIKLVSPN